MKIYSEYEKDWDKEIKILGLTIYNRSLIDHKNKPYCKINILKGFFKTIENKKEKIYYFLGLPMYKKVKPIDYDLLIEALDNTVQRVGNKIYAKVSDTMRLNIIAKEINSKTFSGFKNINQGKTIVLMGAGPTLNYFNPLNDVLYCGLNRVFMYDKVRLDYLFFNDNAFLLTDNASEKLLEYQNDKCIKFVGSHNGKDGWQIPESFLLKLKNIKRYQTNAWVSRANFAFDLEHEIIGNFCTISLQAMQFLLYTNPKKIYLAGIDTSPTGHFIGGEFNEATRNGLEQNDLHNAAAADWAKLKDFARIYYPETEIISINPVGLRGLFRDVYTQEYIDANKEIFADAKVEII